MPLEVPDKYKYFLNIINKLVDIGHWKAADSVIDSFEMELNQKEKNLERLDDGREIETYNV